MNSLHITVPAIPPSGNHYKKPVRRGKFLSWYVTKEAQAFKEQVWAAHVALTRPVLIGDAFEVEAVIYLGHGQRGDTDNFGKVILDSLQYARVFESDAQVTDLTLRKRRDAANPRTEITVRVK